MAKSTQYKSLKEQLKAKEDREQFYDFLVIHMEYDVEEYLFNGKSLKYYFKDSGVKLIRYNGQDIKVIRLEKNTNKEMLIKPEGYKVAIT